MIMMTFGRLQAILMLLPAAFLLMTDAKLTRNKQSIRDDEHFQHERMIQNSNTAAKELKMSDSDEVAVERTKTCSDGPSFELNCDYGTDFACPFPYVSVPFLVQPTCCERTGDDYWGSQGRNCVASGGYHVMGSEPFYIEDEFGDYEEVQLADTNWCCPKETLAPIINEFCHGPVIYADECGTLLDTPLVPVRLEHVAIDYESEHIPYYMYDLIPCYGESLIVCCPKEKILDKTEESSCDGKSTGGNSRGRGRNLILKNTNEKHNDE